MTAAKDVGASVRARLLHLARERGDDFQLLLTRYANERLLYRLAQSRHHGSFILKSATLFTLWTGHPHRATRDVDLLGVGDPSEDRIRSLFAEVIGLDVGDDGVAFDVGSLVVGPIREDQEYGGVRVEVLARITAARVRLQIDVGFGDAVTPPHRCRSISRCCSTSPRHACWPIHARRSWPRSCGDWLSVPSSLVRGRAVDMSRHPRHPVRQRSA